MSGASVVVIGGANVDVIARPHRAPVPSTSNPGVVTVTAGGVGRNIAESLARLGTTCHLVSTVGCDAHGELVLDATSDAGVDVEHVRRVLTTTGTYVALLDEGGELGWAVSDMEATAEIGPADIDDAAHLIGGADLVVLDGNLSSETLQAAWDMALDAGVRVVIDPVSVPKAMTIGRLLSAQRPLFLLSAGRTEIAALGSGATDAAALHDLGVELLWERGGAAGSVLTTSTSKHPLAAPPASVVDVTGAGDAMLAAFCHALLSGAEPFEAAAYGHAAAALTVASRHTVRPDLTDALVRSLL